MWPKLLLDILPHFARLMPMADKYLSTRSASDKAQQETLTALAADVRGGLRQVTEENAGIRGQLQEQNKQMSQLAVDVARARMGTESVETRITKLEKKAALTLRLLWVALGLLAAVVVLLGVPLVEARLR